MNDFPKLGINTKDLEEHVSELIARASEEDRETMGAVNWGDIGVADIEYRLSMFGEPDPWAIVIVEEAAAGCGLQLFLNRNLNRKKFPKTDVICEW